jgi:hypothetical protein
MLGKGSIYQRKQAACQEREVYIKGSRQHTRKGKYILFKVKQDARKGKYILFKIRRHARKGI